MKKLEIGKLNEMYSQAESCDRSVFNEMKSNVKLVAGEHYERQSSGQVRDLWIGPNDQKNKVKITKNLIQKITGSYQDGIMSLSPDMTVVPANETEMQDRKAAELYNSVLQYGKERYKLNERKEDWCQDFVDTAEVCVKVTYDKGKGDFIGYRQKQSEMGQPLFVDPMGLETPEHFRIVIDPMTGMQSQIQHKPAPDKNKPVFSGDFVFEQIFPADLLRSPTAQTMDESPYLIIRKMLDIEEAKRLVPEDDPDREKKLEYVKKSSETTYKIFDLNTYTFEDSKGKVMIREFYYRPCYEFPKGYFAFATESGIITEGELPFGVFPVAWRAFKKRQTNPRGTGIVKIARPYQVEINRASSKEIENQLVHGDDKIVTLPNVKLDQGSSLPGVRQIRAIGAHTVIPGRVGEQYRPYISATIEELFFAVNEEMKEDDSGQLDPVALLYKSVKRKSRYGRAAREFQAFLKEVYWIYLKLAKHYFDDDRVIRAIGRSEALNIQEFREASDLSVAIRLAASNEDAETQVGKYLTFQNILQYVGKDLPRENLGKLLINLPFANAADAFSELVQPTKNLENDLLAMDRGEYVPAQPDDDHALYIKGISSRMKAPDFRYLRPDIQENYANKREEHRQFEAQAMEQQRMAQMEMIPTDGPLTKADLYTNPDPSNPTKVQRAVFPARALEWLQGKLNEQMLTQDRLQVLDQADQIAIQQQGMPQEQMPQQIDPQLEQQIMNEQAFTNQGGINV